MRDISAVAGIWFAACLIGCTSARSAFEDAQRRDTTSSYETFLREHGESEFADRASDRICVLEYEWAVAANTPAAFEAFATKHPDGELAARAGERIESLEFEHAKAKGTVGAYSAFLEKHPGGTNAADAKKGLADAAWELVEPHGSKQELQRFVELYPESLHVFAATARIEELDWQAARSSASRDGFTRFISEHPDGAHRPAAEECLTELRRVDAARIVLGELGWQPLFKRSSSDATVRVAVTNFCQEHGLAEASGLVTRDLLQQMESWLARAKEAGGPIDGQLLLAAREGNLATVRRLLDLGTDLNVRLDGDTSLLLLAVCHRHPELIELALARKADLDLLGPSDLNTDAPRGSALHFAVMNDDQKCVAQLLQNGAHVEVANAAGDTALHLAAASGSVALLDLLLERGAKLDTRNQRGLTPLHVAIEARRELAVRRLLDAGASPVDVTADGRDAMQLAASVGDERLHGMLRDLHDLSLLLDAAARGDRDAVAQILDGGVDVNAADGAGRTAMHRAAEGGHERIVELLIERDADIAAGRLPEPVRGGISFTLASPYTFPDDEYAGTTPLHCAALHGQVAVLKLLLSAGAKAGAPGQSPPSLSNPKHTEGRLAEVLDAAMAHSDSRSNGTWTPLHSAAFAGQSEAVKLLIAAGADVESRYTGKIPRFAEAGPDMVSVANRAQQEGGWTPLHLAAGFGHVGTIEVLALAGARLDVQGPEGATPLLLAERLQKEPAAQRLRELGAK